jgi:hypothetical protein
MSVDVTAVVAEISAQSEAIVALGSAVLLVFVGLKAFRWIGQALSGDARDARDQMRSYDD